MEGECSQYRKLSDSPTNGQSNNEAHGTKKESDLALASVTLDTNLKLYNTIKRPNIYENTLTTEENQNFPRDETYIDEEGRLISLTQASASFEVHAPSLADEEIYSAKEARATKSFISLKTEETPTTGEFSSPLGEERPKIKSPASVGEETRGAESPASVGEETRGAESPASVGEETRGAQSPASVCEETRGAESPASVGEETRGAESPASVGEETRGAESPDSYTSQASFTSVSVEKNIDEECLDSNNGEDIFITEKCLASFSKQTRKNKGGLATRNNEGTSAAGQYSLSFEGKSQVEKDHTSIGESRNDCEKYKALLRGSRSSTSEVHSVSLEEIRAIEECHIYRSKEYTAEKNPKFFETTCTAFKPNMTEELTFRHEERPNEVYAAFEKEMYTAKKDIASLSDEEPDAVEKRFVAHSKEDTQSVEEYLSSFRSETFLTSRNGKDVGLSLQSSEDSTSWPKLCQSLQGHQRNVLEKQANDDLDFRLAQLDKNLLSELPRVAVFLQSEGTVSFPELSDSPIQSEVNVQPGSNILNDLFYNLNNELESYEKGKKEIQKLIVLDDVSEYIELHKKGSLDQALLANYDSDLVEAPLKQDIEKLFLKSEIALPEQKVTPQKNTFTHSEEDGVSTKSPSLTSECTSSQAMLNSGSELDVRSRQIEHEQSDELEENRRTNGGMTRIRKNIFPTTDQLQTVQRQIPFWKKCLLVVVALQASFIILPCFIAFAFLIFLKRYF